MRPTRPARPRNKRSERRSRRRSTRRSPATSPARRRTAAALRARVRPVPARRRAAGARQAPRADRVAPRRSSSCPRDSKETPSLLFRLGELYWEESRDYFFQANRKDDDLIRGARTEGRRPVKSSAKEEKAALLVQRDANAKLAVDQYTQIVQKYRDYARTDEVLFFLGHNLMEHGRGAEGAGRLREAGEEVPEVAVHPRRVPGLRRVLLQQPQGQARLAAQGARGVQAAADYPESQVYALRPLQAGLVPLQPDRLPAGDGHVQGHRPLRRVRRRPALEKQGGGKGEEHPHPRGAQRLRPRLRARGLHAGAGQGELQQASPASPTTASR